jgi:hypothetical protein
MTQDEIIEITTKVYGECDWHESALHHLKAVAELAFQKGYADAMNWKVQNHLEHLPAAQQALDRKAENARELGLDYAPEHVATVISESGANVTHSWWHEPALPIGTKLYTSLPQREWVGLTDEDLQSICDEWQIYNGSWMRVFVRDIEAKLKERNR